MKIDNGGSAFPVPTSFIPAPQGSDVKFVDTDHYGRGPTQGMSLRDWFAGMALQGMLTREVVSEKAVQYSYEYADDMLAERAKERT